MPTARPTTCSATRARDSLFGDADLDFFDDSDGDDFFDENGDDLGFGEDEA